METRSSAVSPTSVLRTLRQVTIDFRKIAVTKVKDKAEEISAAICRREINRADLD